ncbi:uncharacterized protein LOC778711 isoform X1 [Ciona intestinalis]
MTSRAEKITDNQKQLPIPAKKIPADADMRFETHSYDHHESLPLKGNAEYNKHGGNRATMGVQTEGIRVQSPCNQFEYGGQSGGLHAKYGQGLAQSNYANEFCNVARIPQLNTNTTLNRRNQYGGTEDMGRQISGSRIKGFSSVSNTYNQQQHALQYISSSRPASAHDNRKHSNCGIDAPRTTTTGVGGPGSGVNTSMGRSNNRRASKWPQKIAGQEYSRQSVQLNRSKANFASPSSFLPTDPYMTSPASGLSSFSNSSSFEACGGGELSAVDSEESEVLNLCLYNNQQQAGQFFEKPGSFDDARYTLSNKPKVVGQLRKANSLGEVTRTRSEWEKNSFVNEGKPWERSPSFKEAGYPPQCQYSATTHRKTSADCVLTGQGYETVNFDNSLDSLFNSNAEGNIKDVAADFGGSYSIIASDSTEFCQETASAVPAGESWSFESAAGPCAHAVDQVGRKGLDSKLPSPLGAQEKRQASVSLCRGVKNFRVDQTSSVNSGQNLYQVETTRDYCQAGYGDQRSLEYDFRNRNSELQGSLPQSEYQYAKTFEQPKNNDMGVLSEFRAPEDQSCISQESPVADERMTVHSSKTYTVLTSGRCASDTGYSGKNVSRGDRLLMTAMSQSLPMIRRDVRQQSPQHTIESNVLRRNSQCMNSQTQQASSTSERPMEHHSVATPMTAGDISQHHKMLEGVGHLKPFPHLILPPHVPSQLDQHQRILQSTSTYQRQSPKNDGYSHEMATGYESAAILEHRRQQHIVSQAQPLQHQPTHEAQYFPQPYRPAGLPPVSTYGVYPLLPPQHHFMVKQEGSENQGNASTSHKRPSPSAAAYKATQLRDQYYLKPPPVDLDDLSDDERERMRVKRERNRVAAAKCRNRRRELLERLEKEAEQLEREQELLRESVKRLQTQKRKLGVMLDEHETSCTSKLEEEARKSPEDKTETAEAKTDDTDS